MSTQKVYFSKYIGRPQKGVPRFSDSDPEREIELDAGWLQTSIGFSSLIQERLSLIAFEDHPVQFLPEALGNLWSLGNNG